MTIPAKVKRQAEEAARLQEELNAPPAAPEEVATPEVDPDAPTDPAPQPEPPVEQPTPQPEETRDAAYWQQRFQVVDGKYRAEVPRLQNEVKELRGKLTELSEQLEQAKSAPAAGEPKLDANFLTAEEREEFGDLAEVIARVATRIVEARTNPVSQQVKQISEQVHQTKQMTAEDRFFSALTARVPEWPTINQDPAFGEFLGEVEPLIGRVRQELLDEAFNAFDVERVARFFAAFQASRPTKPAAPPRPSPDRKVQPTSRPQAPAPAAGKVYTTAEINEFYKDKSLGKWKGRETEARAIEHDILAAGAEGRIIR